MNSVYGKEGLRRLATTAMLSALAYAATLLFHFEVMFLTLDLKDAIIAIASLLYGPLYGVGSALLVALIEFISISDTGVYGLIMNILSSGVFAFTVGAVYKARRRFSGAIAAAGAATLAVTAVMLLANLFITPFYMGVERSDVVALLPTLLLPFNLTKGILNAALMLLLYKPVITALRRARLVPKSSGEYRFGLKSVLLIVGSVVVAIAAVLFILLYLDGSIAFF